jgi:hypothetical protein
MVDWCAAQLYTVHSVTVCHIECGWTMSIPNIRSSSCKAGFGRYAASGAVLAPHVERWLHISSSYTTLAGRGRATTMESEESKDAFNRSIFPCAGAVMTVVGQQRATCYLMYS